ncbi:MAG: GxxExxY protein [Chthoniobacterales bacterium]|nr:GxxExxY protein [Chthoniobacterales bacterium]
MNLETRKPGRELGNRELTERVIGAAVRVHTALGPGFLESIYEEALSVELRLLRVQFERQKPVPIFYRGHAVGEHRLDLLIESSVVVELKAITALENVHFATVRSYLKALGLEDALLLNFNATRLVVKRVGREYTPSVSPDEVSF